DGVAEPVRDPHGQRVGHALAHGSDLTAAGDDVAGRRLERHDAQRRGFLGARSQHERANGDGHRARAETLARGTAGQPALAGWSCNETRMVHWVQKPRPIEKRGTWKTNDCGTSSSPYSPARSLNASATVARPRRTVASAPKRIPRPSRSIPVHPSSRYTP